MQYLQQRSSATFFQLFEDIGTRIAAVVTFIALLELVRAGRIKIQQSVPFAELRVYRGDRFEAPLQPIDLVSTEQTIPELVEQ
jgi:chromatin segregation and condensation protein Rec8/ScpA/Scc1 (kleisin family)